MKSMMPYAAAPAATLDPPAPISASTLCDALASETRLLADLIGIVRRQRDAAARRDLPAVDECVFAAQRVLRTLNEARRRRHAIYRMLGAPEHAGARAVAAALGPALAPEPSAALELLMDAALELAREVESSRTALRAALSADDPG